MKSYSYVNALTPATNFSHTPVFWNNPQLIILKCKNKTYKITPWYHYYQHYPNNLPVNMNQQSH